LAITVPTLNLRSLRPRGSVGPRCGRRVARGVLLALALALAACTRSGTSDAPAATVRFAIAADPQTLDPLFAHADANSVEQQLARLAFEPFIDIDERGRQVPVLLARIPTVANGDLSRDGRTIVYHLRHGVRWQDGVPVTAADVLFTLHAITDPRNPVRSREGYDRVAHAERIDDFTVRVTLKSAWAPAVATLFSYGTAPQYVLPEHVLARETRLDRAAFGSAPLGDGPYRFVSWQRGNRLEYAVNPAY
jgi:peptide/nickel transport system substrate-binding protein